MRWRGAHFFERGRHLARAAGYARVAEQDHFSTPGQAVDHGRVPMVHGAGEVLVENQWHIDRVVELGQIFRIDAIEEQLRVEVRSLAEAAVGETDAVGFDKLRRSRLVTMLGHWDSFGETIALASSSVRPRRPIGTPVTRARLF